MPTFRPLIRWPFIGWFIYSTTVPVYQTLYVNPGGQTHKLWYSQGKGMVAVTADHPGGYQIPQLLPPVIRPLVRHLRWLRLQQFSIVSCKWKLMASKHAKGTRETSTKRVL